MPSRTDMHKNLKVPADLLRRLLSEYQQFDRQRGEEVYAAKVREDPKFAELVAMADGEATVKRMYVSQVEPENMSYERGYSRLSETSFERLLSTYNEPETNGMSFAASGYFGEISFIWIASIGSQVKVEVRDDADIDTMYRLLVPIEEWARANAPTPYESERDEEPTPARDGRRFWNDDVKNNLTANAWWSLLLLAGIVAAIVAMLAFDFGIGSK